MKSVFRQCEKCRQFFSATIEEGCVSCPHCQTKWQLGEENEYFVRCPFCKCKQFYIQKDFRREIGCALVFVGIVLVPFTYGLSLPVLALVDWLIYRNVPMMVVCYLCETDFKGFTPPEGLKPFIHSRAVKYDTHREEMLAEGSREEKK